MYFYNRADIALIKIANCLEANLSLFSFFLSLPLISSSVFVIVAFSSCQLFLPPVNNINSRSPYLGLLSVGFSSRLINPANGDVMAGKTTRRVVT